MAPLLMAAKFSVLQHHACYVQTIEQDPVWHHKFLSPLCTGSTELLSFSFTTEYPHNFIELVTVQQLTASSSNKSVSHLKLVPVVGSQNKF